MADKKTIYRKHLEAKIQSFYQVLDKDDTTWTFEDLECVARSLVLFEEACVKDYALRLIRWCVKHSDYLNANSMFCNDFILYLRFYFCEHEDSYATFREVYTKEEAREVASWIYNVGIPHSEDGYVTLKDNSLKRLIRGLDFWSELGGFIP